MNERRLMERDALALLSFLANGEYELSYNKYPKSTILW